MGKKVVKSQEAILQEAIQGMMKEKWYNNDNALRLYLHFLGTQDHEGKIEFSIRKLAKVLGITERGVRSALKMLGVTHLLTHQVTQFGHTLSSTHKGISQERDTVLTQQVTQQVTQLEEKKPEEVKMFTPPTVEEVKQYFKESGYMESVGVKARTYYNTSAWNDSTGKRVKNWKQKMIGVWFKEENKIPVEKYIPPHRRIERLTDEEMTARMIERGIIPPPKEE